MENEAMDTQSNASIIDVNFDDVYEFELLENDSEAELSCTFAELHLSKNGNLSLHLKMEVVGVPEVDDIHVYVGIPDRRLQEDDKKAYNKRMIALRDAYTAFGLPLEPTMTAERFVGCRAWALIGIEEAEGGFQARNGVRKWVQRA